VKRFFHFVSKDNSSLVFFNITESEVSYFLWQIANATSNALVETAKPAMNLEQDETPDEEFANDLKRFEIRLVIYLQAIKKRLENLDKKVESLFSTHEVRAELRSSSSLYRVEKSVQSDRVNNGVDIYGGGKNIDTGKLERNASPKIVENKGGVVYGDMVRVYSESTDKDFMEFIVRKLFKLTEDE
jgi:archaellum component FlaC